jgi:hypothetical protein
MEDSMIDEATQYLQQETLRHAAIGSQSTAGHGFEGVGFS